ncbi:MAG TPA: N-acetylmannosamine-6-phosphate 2-epimerase [Firmicutes bacterium]|jgi:N-acylglucosamine-6-phosphate 2-epimerase|nr:N-acetylmannosamine-6-phosphate 2-epimerase [Bacillota bacterium]
MNILNRGLIVSCQALEDEPLFGMGIMTKMAMAAKAGGAIGLRVNGLDDIIAIKKECDLPVIGIIKKVYRGYDVYITPTMNEVAQLVTVNPDIIALDATMRQRPEFEKPEEFIAAVKKRFNVCIMADISNFEEGFNAFQAGSDMIATTLALDINYGMGKRSPDLDLIRKLAAQISIPVIAEGNIESPEQAVECLKAGAYAVVVGSAITRPQLITKRFVEEINDYIILE